MSCFSCLHSGRKDAKIDIDTATRSNSRYSSDSSVCGRGRSNVLENGKLNGKAPGNTGAYSFTFKELAAATQNFREANLIGEGGFGRV